MPDTSSSSENDYVTNAAWLRTAGRPDAIDDVADQFERSSGSAQFWTPETTSWPHRLRGRRTSSFVRHAEGARLAG